MCYVITMLAFRVPSNKLSSLLASSANDLYTQQTELSTSHQLRPVNYLTFPKLRGMADASHSMIACSIIGSQIDFCNSLFYTMTNRKLNKLQRVQNRAARIVCGTGSQQTSSTQQLNHLPWLPVRSKIQFKLSTLCFRSRMMNQPQYLSDTLHSYQPTRLLRSSTQDLLTVPRCKTVFGSRRF